MGLSWEDVNFSELTVHIRHSYDDKGELNVPKTKASLRVLPMSETVRDALKTRLDAQMAVINVHTQENLKTDDDGNVIGVMATTPVICDMYGVRIHPTGLGHWWYNHRADYGLEGWALHQLRHSFLTLAAQQGVHPSVCRSSQNTPRRASRWRFTPMRTWMTSEPPWTASRRCSHERREQQERP